ncbi:MutS domain V [Seiridium cupressi]
MLSSVVYSWIVPICLVVATKGPDLTSLHSQAKLQSQEIKYGLGQATRHYIEDIIDHFHVPSLTIAVLHGNKTYLDAFGQAVLPNTPATPDTLYYIASCTKSFTAASLIYTLDNCSKTHPTGQQWSVNSKLRDILGDDFVLPSDYATQHASLKDALAHRLGIPRHDMSYGGAGYGITELVRSLRHLPMFAELREEWRYLNQGYMLIQAVIQKLTGLWIGNVHHEAIWGPLGMHLTSTNLSVALELDRSGKALLSQGYSYNPFTRKLQAQPPTDTELVGGGGIISSVSDMAKWVRALMEGGKGLPLRAEDVKSLTTPLMVKGGHERFEHMSPTLYAMGWQTAHYRGVEVVEHGGEVMGYTSQMAFLPDKQWGVVILANADEYGNQAMSSVFIKLLDDFLGVEESDRQDVIKAQEENLEREIEAWTNARERLFPDVPDQPVPRSLPLEAYAGTYWNAGYRSLNFRTALPREFTPVHKSTDVVLRADSRRVENLTVELEWVTGEQFLGWVNLEVWALIGDAVPAQFKLGEDDDLDLEDNDHIGSDTVGACRSTTDNASPSSSCYSAHEHSTLQAHRAASLASLTASQAAASTALPIDIAIETVVATIVVVLGLVLNTAPLRPIRWRVWAGQIEREGDEAFKNADGDVARDYVGNPFKLLETRPGFVDIRKQRTEFAEWVKGQGQGQGQFKALRRGSVVSRRRRGIVQHSAISKLLRRANLGYTHPGRPRGRARYPVPSSRIVASSPPVPRGQAARQRLSTPNPPGYSASPGVHTPASAHRSSTVNSRRSATSSPQLPPHPQRQRLSLRPASLRRTSATSAQSQVDEDEQDHDLADDQLNADALNEVIMAMDMNKAGDLGCAYYIAAEEKLLLLEDVPMAGHEIIETLLLHAKPSTVLTPSRASHVLLDLLSKGAEGEDQDDHHRDWPGAYILRNLTAPEFRYDTAKEKLLGLRIQSQGDLTMLFTNVADECMDDHDEYQDSMQGSLMRLGTSINLDSRLTIGCAGAVLSDLNRRRTAEYLPGDPDALVAFRVKSLEMFKLFDSMFINADTLASLQILQSELHPNSQMRGPDKSSSGAKESLSVYGLFHYLACTPQGKSKLRQVFLRPSMDINLIKNRQQAISFFLRPDHSDNVATLTKELRKVKNMRMTVAYLQKGVDSPGKKHSMASNNSEEIQVIRKVLETIQHGSLHRIGELITRTVDFEQSRERQRTAVKQGVDPNLDELKRSYHGMEDFLTDVNAKLHADIPDWAQRYVQGCVFYPQLGFLTVVSLNPQTGNANYEGEGLNDVWERIFADDGVVYCKNRRMREIDEHFGDAYCMIIDREVEILHELSAQVLEHEDAILTASDVIGDLDSLFALAIGSGKYNWIAPVITNENVLYVEAGRHPLQELVVPSFVPNDCYMSGGNGDQEESVPGTPFTQDAAGTPSMVILTGPNHSGKSVYLKQTALIVYLAHIGCYVPARRATIGITDRILTRIATRESVSRDESAFAIDLRQAAFAMNFATRRSLILVDEFGKGTNTVDGAGLMTALLHHFSTLGSQRPKLLAATHFHEIFEAGFLSENSELSFAHMSVHVDFDTPIAEEQVAFLFSLQPGRSVSSFGSTCAAVNGIDEAIVERAEAIMLLLVRGEDLEAACSKLTEAEEFKLMKAEAAARAFLEHDIESPRSSGKKREGYYRDILRSILAASEESSMSDVA